MDMIKAGGSDVFFDMVLSHVMIILLILNMHLTLITSYLLVLVTFLSLWL